MMGKAVEEADNYKNQRVGNHYNLVAHAVNNSADYGRGKETGYCRYGKQQAYRCGISSVVQNQYIRTEGEEHLFASAVKHFEHVVFCVLFVEIKAAFC